MGSKYLTTACRRSSTVRLTLFAATKETAYESAVQWIPDQAYSTEIERPAHDFQARFRLTVIISLASATYFIYLLICHHLLTSMRNTNNSRMDVSFSRFHVISFEAFKLYQYTALQPRSSSQAGQ